MGDVAQLEVQSHVSGCPVVGALGVWGNRSVCSTLLSELFIEDTLNCYGVLCIWTKTKSYVSVFTDDVVPVSWSSRGLCPQIRTNSFTKRICCSIVPNTFVLPPSMLLLLVTFSVLVLFLHMYGWPCQTFFKNLCFIPLLFPLCDSSHLGPNICSFSFTLFLLLKLFKACTPQLNFSAPLSLCLSLSHRLTCSPAGIWLPWQHRPALLDGT